MSYLHRTQAKPDTQPFSRLFLTHALGWLIRDHPSVLVLTSEYLYLNTKSMARFGLSITIRVDICSEIRSIWKPFRLRAKIHSGH